MKQKFRIIRNNQNHTYNFIQIQLLEESKSGDILMGSFGEIGSITFQQTKGETEWYGMRYVIDTTRQPDLEKMNRVAKFIHKHSTYRIQPEELIEILGGVEYYLCNQEFFKVADKGKYCYTVVYKENGYGRFIAKDDLDANKKFEKFKANRKNDAELYSLGKSKFLIE